MIEAQSGRSPDAMAVTDASRSLTYRQLNGRANTLAREIRAVGVRREMPVGLYLERSTEALIAFLAVLKAGATAHLYDPRWPRERSRAVLTNLPPRLVLAAPGVIPPGADAVAVRPVDGAALELAPDGEVPLHPDNLAYVVYTSGSTGRPKPVGVTHRSVSHCVATHLAGHRIVPADRSSWLSSPGSSAGVGEIWPYLAAGATVHVGGAGIVESPAELRDWLLRRGVTKSFVAAPTATELCRLRWPADTPLRLLTVGGDRVPRWAPASLPFEVAVSYGSAEANGVTSCINPWSGRRTSHTATDLDRAAPPPVGRPWPDVRVHVMDEFLDPLPAGDAGEVYVAGPELTRGYLGRPALTAARLVPDPGGHGGRLYRTGDLGALDADGTLHHRGRTDHLVKVRGHRVELGDIEAALAEHAEVAAAVVVGVEDEDGATRLGAYVVSEPDAAGRLSVAELRRFLHDRLPDHMVPGGIAVVERLPRNANGKVDRRALPDLFATGEEIRQSPRHEAPRGRDQVVQEVCRLWSAYLGVETADPADDFRECGGNSLIAGRLVACLRDELRVPLSLREFLRRPTLGALIDQVRAHRGG